MIGNSECTKKHVLLHHFNIIMLIIYLRKNLNSFSRGHTCKKKFDPLCDYSYGAIDALMFVTEKYAT